MRRNGFRDTSSPAGQTSGCNDAVRTSSHRGGATCIAKDQVWSPPIVFVREATKKPAFAWVITSAAFLMVASSLALLPGTVGVTGDLPFLGTTPLLTQAQGLTGTWTNVSPTYAPVPYGVPSIAYVPASHGSILFGGSLQSSETWRYRSDEKNWSQLYPQSSPPPMMGASMAYDSGVGKAVLFGGIWVRSDHSVCAGNDTWLYDPLLNTWTNVSPPDSPPYRSSASMVYDPVTQRVVLFGGHHFYCGGGIPEQTGPRLNDTWTYDARANTWTNVTGPIAPPARSEMGFVYDPRDSRIVLFGGIPFEPFYPASYAFGDTWVLDSTTYGWTHYDPLAKPSARYRLGMAFVPNVTILYGGCSTSGCYQDTWAYDIPTDAWTELPSNSGPPFAPGAAFAFDPSGVVVAFGKSETWELRVTSSTQGGPTGNPLTSGYLIPSALAIAGAGAVFVGAWWLRARSRRPKAP